MRLIGRNATDKEMERMASPFNANYDEEWTPGKYEIASRGERKQPCKPRNSSRLWKKEWLCWLRMTKISTKLHNSTLWSLSF